MPERTAIIGSSVGLHARPASIFVQQVTATGLPVLIRTADKPDADARSILAVMALGAKQGDRVSLSLDEDPDDVLSTLAELLERDLD